MTALFDRLQIEEREHTLSVRHAAGVKELSGDSLFAGQRRLMTNILAVGNQGPTKAQYAAIKEWSFVCIKAIAQRAAGQPVRVGIVHDAENVTDDRTARRLSKGLPRSLQKHAAKIEVIDSHPIIDSIERPNRAMTKWQLLYTLTASMLATGKAYWLILPREGAEEGLSIWPLPAHWVTPDHRDGLFGQYKVMPEGSFLSEIVDGDQMAYFFFPDPSDPLKAISTLATQSRAINVDEHIQKSQEQIFKNGMIPKVILRAGRLPGFETGDKGVRPTLTPIQRKQITAVINRLYAETTNAGAPMIIDGVIEGIERFSQTAQEMDFIQSGEAVKKRIFQAFGVPPFIVGEKQTGSHAMASVVVQGFYDNTVNPLLDMISQALTAWLGPMFDPGVKTVVWIEPAVAEDREWSRKVWDKARERGDVTDEEFRAEVLGLPPNDELARRNRKPKFFDNPQAMAQMTLMIQQVAAGELNELSAAYTLSSFAEYTVDEALLVVTGSRGEFTPHLLLEGPDKSYHRPRVRPKPRRRFTRSDAVSLHLKQLDASERRIERRARKLIRSQFESAAKNLRRMAGKSVSLTGIAGNVFNPRDWDKPLEAAMRPVLFRAMADGAFAELAVFGAKIKNVQSAGKARVVGIPEIEAIQERMNMPDWMADRLNDELDVQFQQDYWPAINDTTGGQINDIILQGTVGGQTISQMASAIARASGDQSKVRGTLIARTECLPASAVVDAANITAVYKRWHEGEMFEVVTAASHKFTGTANHPMLTQRGWVALSQLTKIDSLIGHEVDIEQFGSARDENVEDPPATIGEIFDSLAAVVIASRERTRKPDFHGDGMDGYVDVLRPDRLLQHGMFAPVNKSGLDEFFSPAESRTIILAALTAPFGKDVAIQQSYRLCDAAKFDVVLPQNLRHDPPLRSEIRSDGIHGFTGLISRQDDRVPVGILAGEHSSASVRERTPFDAGANESAINGVDADTHRESDILTRKSGRIKVDRVRSLRRIESWKGHVYNLTTREGYFLADGLYTGNSTGAQNAGHAAAMDALADTGLVIGKRWSSVLGNTTRDTHRALHDVVVKGTKDADALFNVGGHMAPYPGHFSLPPEERANCFPAGTLVQGDFIGAQRAWYEGTFSEIVTRFGRRLTVTENHPIVTTHGLVAAGKIKPGDKVMVYRSEIDVSPVMRSGCDQVQNEPVAIEEIFESLAAACGIEVRRTQMDDFYGDGEFINGDIEIVRTDGKLLRYGEIQYRQKMSDSIFIFESAELSQEFGCGDSRFGSIRDDSASASLPGGGQQLLRHSRPIGSVTPAGSLAVGIGANFDTSLYESSRQEGPRIAGFRREALERHARFVSFDDVVEIRNFYSAGHVYDLQSKYGLVIASDNVASVGLPCNGSIVTQNCQCTILSETVVDDLEERILEGDQGAAEELQSRIQGILAGLP